MTKSTSDKETTGKTARQCKGQNENLFPRVGSESALNMTLGQSVLPLYQSRIAQLQAGTALSTCSNESSTDNTCHWEHFSDHKQVLFTCLSSHVVQRQPVHRATYKAHTLLVHERYITCTHRNNQLNAVFISTPNETLRLLPVLGSILDTSI